ncbi:MAG: tetratricopeptide repeat protein [Desulfuromonadaceae bacterium]|nr:tetratricopeptide repeat protein [Desulfuromonadaceae bacterium]MDD5104104.1 tetratricopeptide repeat protein [Desulfuromonadaceae bacterium]
MTGQDVTVAAESSAPPENSLLPNFIASTRSALVLIVLVGIIVYSNTLHSPFIYDDYSNIVNNVEIRNLSSFFDGASLLKLRYFGRLSFAINYHFGLLDPFGYHVVNITIHLLAALLVFGLVLVTARTPLFRLSEHTPRQSVFQVIALYAALLFVAHPVQTQAVTYIVQRFASLATLLYLLSLVSYIKGRLETESPVRTRTPYFLISFLAAVAAMESKETALTLPFMIGLYEFTFFRGSVLKRLGYIGLIATTLLIIPFQVVMIRLSSSTQLLTPGNLLTENASIPRDLYFYSQFGVIITYIRLIFLPINQTIDYYHSQYSMMKFFQFSVIAPLFLLLSIIILAFYLHIRGMRKNRPLLCLIAFGVFWFFLALSIESSIIPISDLIFEHRVYLPSVGAFIAIATGTILLLGKLSRNSNMFRHAVLVVMVISITAYATATLARNAVWKDEISINRDNVKKTPLRGLAHNNLGYAYLVNGMYELAAQEFRTAIDLEPELAPAIVYDNLGIALKQLYRYEEAIAAFEKASQKAPDNKVFRKNLTITTAEHDKLKKYFTSYGTKPGRLKR